MGLLYIALNHKRAWEYPRTSLNGFELVVSAACAVVAVIDGLASVR